MPKLTKKSKKFWVEEKDRRERALDKKCVCRGANQNCGFCYGTGYIAEERSATGATASKGKGKPAEAQPEQVTPEAMAQAVMQQLSEAGISVAAFRKAFNAAAKASA